MWRWLTCVATSFRWSAYRAARGCVCDRESRSVHVDSRNDLVGEIRFAALVGGVDSGQSRLCGISFEQRCSFAAATAVVNASRPLSDPSTPTRMSAGGSVKRGFVPSPYARHASTEAGARERHLGDSCQIDVSD